jgi:hypothetical protein
MRNVIKRFSKIVILGTTINITSFLDCDASKNE